jgi:hypothetical protein
MTTEDGDVIGGIDTHKHTHYAAVIDTLGRLLGHQRFPATDSGYAALLSWMRTFGPTARSTSSPSSACVTTNPPAPTSNDGPTKASTNARSSAASSATSPAKSTPISHAQKPTRPPSPQPLDKHRSIERSHRIDAEEFYALLDGLVIDDAKIFNNKLKEWED